MRTMVAAVVIGALVVAAPAIADPIDEVEPNNDLSTAVSVIRAQPYKGSVKARDVDAYRVDITAPGVTATIRNVVPACEGRLSGEVQALSGSTRRPWTLRRGIGGGYAPIDLPSEPLLLTITKNDLSTSECDPINYEVTFTALGDDPTPYLTPSGPATPLPTGDAAHDSLLTAGPRLAPGVNYSGVVPAGRALYYEMAVAPGRTAEGLLTWVSGKCAPNAYVTAVIWNGQDRNPHTTRFTADNSRYSVSLKVPSRDRDERFYIEITATCPDTEFRIGWGPSSIAVGAPTPMARIGPSATPVIVTGQNPVVMTPGVVYQRTMTSTMDAGIFSVRLTGHPEQARVVTMLGAMVCRGPFRVYSPLDEVQMSFGSIDPNNLGSSYLRSDTPREVSLVVREGCAGHTYQIAVEPGPMVAAPDPPRPAVRTSSLRVSLKRRGRLYSGRVIAVRAICAKSRSVKLVRRNGRTVARVRSRADGTFRLRTRRRLGGKLRAVVAESRPLADLRCRAGKSRLIRG